MNRNSPKVLYPLIILGQLIAGGTFPLAKIAITYIEPLTLACVRFVMASVVLLIIVYVTGRMKKINKEDIWKLILLGICAVPLNQLLFLYGLKYTTPGRSALYYGATPVFVFLLAVTFLKEKIKLRKVLGIILSFAGVAAILYGGGKLQGSVVFGDTLVILAVVAWAAYTVLGKNLIHKYGSLTITAYAMAVGTALYFPFGIYRAATFDYSTVPAAAWFSLLYIAIITSVIGYIIWFYALARMEASKLAIFQNLQPIIAAVLSVIVVGEVFSLDFYIGGILVLAGVFITQRS